MDIFQKKLDQLNKEAKEVPVLQEFENKTGFKPIFLVFGVIVIVLLMVMSGYLAALLANLTGFAYPAYRTIKSLESPAVDDDKQWLTYWTVYGCFIVVDDWAHWITGMVPQYYLIKLIFLIWLYAPTTRGASLLYNKVIRGLFSKYHHQLDNILNRVIGEASTFYASAKKDMSDPSTIKKVADFATDVNEKIKNRTKGETALEASLKE